MIVTKENYNQIDANEREKILLKALLEDLEYINKLGPIELKIQYQDWHDEYSPERVDPCPDYYGMYSLLVPSGNKIGLEMYITELDSVICLLTEFLEEIDNENNSNK